LRSNEKQEKWNTTPKEILFTIFGETVMTRKKETQTVS
jgi:hypothetical protein